MLSLMKRAPTVQVLLMIWAWVAPVGSALQSLRDVRPLSASQNPCRQVPSAQGVVVEQAVQEAGAVPTWLS
jgi:hypothetical protein